MSVPQAPVVTGRQCYSLIHCFDFSITYKQVWV